MANVIASFGANLFCHFVSLDLAGHSGFKRYRLRDCNGLLIVSLLLLADDVGLNV